MTAKIKGITWEIKPPYLHKPNNDKKRKDVELKIDNDFHKAYTYIAKYSRISEEEVIEKFKGNQ